MADLVIGLRDGTKLLGSTPVVIIGPNGSGKTREAHRLGDATPHPIEFVNALRNTRISPQLPTMSQLQARQQHAQGRESSRNQPWEMTGDFDVALSQLLAEDGDSARNFRDKSKAGETTNDIPVTALERVAVAWERTFPGRRLEWKDWSPIVHNEKGDVVTYSANQMSDGERAALYLMSKILLAAPDQVVVVDEPETHLHSQLAVRLWDSLQAVREDLRFVYVTHDLVFALSREPATFLLADPRSGLVPVEVDATLPTEVQREILGAASFSYFASRVVFCEGDDRSYDKQFLSAWFHGRDTVVLPVGSCTSVRQCVASLNGARLIDNLDAIGIVDRDFLPDKYFSSLEVRVSALPIHEIEAVVCLPAVVTRLAAHLARHLSKAPEQVIVDAITPDMIARVAFERARQSVLNSVEDAVLAKPAEVTEAKLREHLTAVEGTIANSAPLVATYEAELLLVQAICSGGNIADVLRVMPSKQLAAAISSSIATSTRAMFDLVCGALAAQPGEPLHALGADLAPLIAELGLPERKVAERSFTAA